MKKCHCTFFTVLISGLLLLIITSSYGQYYSISGVLNDMQSGEPLRGAHIYLLDRDSAMVTATISEGSGKFLMERLQPGEYTLQFTFVGYDLLEKVARITDRDLDLRAISMRLTPALLEGATVTGHTPMAIQIGDTTQFNADAFTTMPDASAEDLVEKLPGVVIEDGKIEAMGEEVEQVLVDGRPFFRNDPSAALKTLPAEVIDKIQIFDKESDQAQFTGFSDGETQKTMNIITRVNMRNGTFGKMSAGIGYDDEETGVKYAAGGNINFFKGSRRITLMAQSNNVNQQNFSSEDLLGVLSSGRTGGGMGAGGGGRPGGMGGRMPGGGRPGGSVNDFIVANQPGISTTQALGVNYSDAWGEKVDVTASYFFNHVDNNATETLYRLYTVGSDSGQTYSEKSITGSNNINHRFNMRLEYNIDENNAIFFRPRITLQQHDGHSSFEGESFAGSTLLNRFENTSTPDLAALDFSNNLLYRHRFKKDRRTLSLSTTTRITNQNGGSLLGSVTEYYTLPLYSETLDQRSTLLSDGWQLSGNLIYTEPAGAHGMLQFNYMASYREDDSDKKSYNYNQAALDYTDLDTMLSNTFNNNYVTQRAGAGYMYNQNKLFMTARLELQNASLFNHQEFPSGFDMEKSYQNILVTAIMKYRPARTKNLRLVYRTSTRPPSVSQLQEVVDNSNTVQLQTGNTDLDQTYTHTAFARYSAVNPESSRVFFAMLFGSITTDYIANHTLYATRDTLLESGLILKQGTQLIMPVNLDGYRSVRSFITYGLPLHLISSNLNLNFGYNLSRSPGMVNDLLNYSNSHKATLGVVISSNISEHIDFTISGRSGYNIIHNSYNTDQDYNYFEQRTRFRMKGVLPGGGFLLESMLTHRITNGLSSSYDQDSWIWTAAIGRKLFKNRLGEVKLGVYDILNQSQSIQRNVGDIYVEDVQNNILQRYLMLTFTYNIRQFTAPEKGSEEDFRNQMMRLKREMN